jgi:hypothetical protein
VGNLARCHVLAGVYGLLLQLPGEPGTKHHFEFFSRRKPDYRPILPVSAVGTSRLHENHEESVSSDQQLLTSSVSVLLYRIGA